MGAEGRGRLVCRNGAASVSWLLDAALLSDKNFSLCFFFTFGYTEKCWGSLYALVGNHDNCSCRVTATSFRDYRENNREEEQRKRTEKKTRNKTKGHTEDIPTLFHHPQRRRAGAGEKRRHFYPATQGLRHRRNTPGMLIRASGPLWPPPAYFSAPDLPPLSCPRPLPSASPCRRTPRTAARLTGSRRRGEGVRAGGLSIRRDVV